MVSDTLAALSVLISPNWKLQVEWLYFVAFALVVTGLIIYSKTYVVLFEFIIFFFGYELSRYHLV